MAIQADALDALGDAAITTIEECVHAQRQPNPIESGKLPATVTQIHQEGTRIMNELIMLAGSGSIYCSSAQQRRWRDLRCMAQHVVAGIGRFGDYGVARINDAALSSAARH